MFKCLIVYFISKQQLYCVEKTWKLGTQSHETHSFIQFGWYQRFGADQIRMYEVGELLSWVIFIGTVDFGECFATSVVDSSIR